jgi:glucose-1-phosphate cytidylyltransferase
MKVVLFCGGLGMRLRDYSDTIPKPMVTVGQMPLLWYVMKYYAHFGHRDFILCLGYRGEAIKNYFLKYSEAESNDFVLSDGGKNVQLLSSDIHDWRITFVDSGLNANIGQRLLAVREHLQGEDVFLANYSDGLTNLPLPKLINHFHKHKAVAAFLAVRPNLTFHFVTMRNGGQVAGLEDVAGANLRINGGCYVFSKDIFKYLHDGEELVREPFQRLIKLKKLVAYKYDGFWEAMDTFKDKQHLDDLHARGNAPWEVWEKTSASK